MLCLQTKISPTLTTHQQPMPKLLSKSLLLPLHQHVHVRLIRLLLHRSLLPQPLKPTTQQKKNFSWHRYLLGWHLWIKINQLRLGIKSTQRLMKNLMIIFSYFLSHHIIKHHQSKNYNFSRYLANPLSISNVRVQFCLSLMPKTPLGKGSAL